MLKLQLPFVELEWGMHLAVRTRPKQRLEAKFGPVNPDKRTDDEAEISLTD